MFLLYTKLLLMLSDHPLNLTVNLGLQFLMTLVIVILNRMAYAYSRHCPDEP